MIIEKVKSPGEWIGMWWGGTERYPMNEVGPCFTRWGIKHKLKRWKPDAKGWIVIQEEEL